MTSKKLDVFYQMEKYIKDKQIIPYIDLSGYKLMEEEVDGVYLSWSELSKVYHLDLSNGDLPTPYNHCNE